MTSDNLLKFLGNREYLHQVSYQELKSLVVQYPYSLSLRYLLAVKSKQEDNTDLGRNIEMLATYGIDRSYLHELFSEDPIVLEDLGETIIMGEDYLELKELSALEREMEGNLIEQENNNISFLEEEIPAPSINTELIANENKIDNSDDSTKSETLPQNEESEGAIPEDNEVENETILPEVVAAASIIGGTTILPEEKDNKQDSTDTPSPDEQPVNNEILVQKEEAEDFIVMDFEEDNLENLGTTGTGEGLAPSESIPNQEIEVEENGLPADAVEVNDPYNSSKTMEEEEINDLFNEAEAEILAEEAVSDSNIFIDNPEALLVEESKKVLSVSEEVVVEAANNSTEETEINQSDKTISQIPFEVSYSDIDPVSIKKDEEISVTSSLTNEVDESSVINEEEPNIIEDANEENTNEPESLKQKTSVEAFKFDSLDQLEATLHKSDEPIASKPTPKSGFNSWKERFSGVSSLSGVDLVPLNKSTGKVVKKKRKVARKQFEKTVAFAEESLTMTEGIASETLAQLLVKQGQYSQARAMYKELCLIIPEKSSFFAGEIEKIQNLPDEPS